MAIKIGKYYITKNNPRELLKQNAELQNNWNELKKELKLNLPFKVVGVNRMLNKMQEIENKDFNDMTHMFDNATTIEPFLKEIEEE